jgi:hypothetical protein
VGTMEVAGEWGWVGVVGGGLVGGRVIKWY